MSLRSHPVSAGLTLLCALLLAACDPAPQTDRYGDGGPDAGRAGFAGLGAANDGYAHARPGTRLNFPGDHGPHPGFRIEWWYLTANLEDASGEPLGMQWTLFRQAQQPDTDTAPDPRAQPWATDQLWMAHMALSRGASHRVAERFARGTSRPRPQTARQAGVTAQPFRAWLDNWQLESLATDPTIDALSHLRLNARAEDAKGPFGYRLDLRAEGPLVRHGLEGFSQKSADGQGSMYYSQPFYRVHGEILLDGAQHTVTGRAWLDREWSSQLLSPTQTGWDWFSLHLNSGARVMAFRLRGGGDNNGDYYSGSWITPEGKVTPLKADTLKLEPLARAEVAGQTLPVRWRMTLPQQDLTLDIAARHPNRWMRTSVPYWEGAVTVKDATTGAPRGQGYLEMTGY
ncbi:lipocalin-like domain-containing protein [Marinobacter sp. X15-166B]|uniref:lipocalin-like domain-containing protein n=1 Tax=Marinobacter sp. X15-166B TaxID=1897620 RepID=UPI00085CD936|nr:lipocalin-like domain-containing protein [Marinobacter sp. X15-166B]OEY67523.1 iron ABC transporter permease [Marinobacter sp. X15-166B]